MNIASFRPSNIIRLIENTVGTVAVVAAGGTVLAARGVASGARRAKHAAAQTAHDISIEMEARRIAKDTAERVARDEKLARLSADERAAFEADERAIWLRTQELLIERKQRA